MGRKRNFVISEELGELEKYKTRITDFKSSQQLNCLILIKSEKYKTLHEVASHFGVSYSTVQRWLSIYKSQGIDKLLQPQSRDKPSKIMTDQATRALSKRLHSSKNPFSGYVEVQQWLLKEHSIKIKYQWLWKFMRTKMKSRLKVPRKTNIKKEKGAEEIFF